MHIDPDGKNNVGLAKIGRRGEQFRATLNSVLDSCEACCARLGVRLAEVLIGLEGVEDILIGLMFLAEGYVPMAGMECPEQELQPTRGNQ